MAALGAVRGHLEDLFNANDDASAAVMIGLSGASISHWRLSLRAGWGRAKECERLERRLSPAF